MPFRDLSHHLLMEYVDTITYHAPNGRGFTKRRVDIYLGKNRRFLWLQFGKNVSDYLSGDLVMWQSLADMGQAKKKVATYCRSILELQAARDAVQQHLYKIGESLAV